jgi:hypothetical protein
MHPRYHRHRHRNIFLFIASFIAVIAFTQSPIFSQFSQLVDNLPFVFAFIAGALFASTFTAIAGGLIIVHLATTLNPILLILIAGLGTVTCDALMFLLFKDNVSSKVSQIYQEIEHHSHLKKIIHTKYFAWTLPVLGALVLASPLPDELGISLLGLSQTTMPRFLLVSLISHLFGIGSIVVGSRIL